MTRFPTFYDPIFDLTDVPALIYNINTAARRFGTIHVILRSHSLAQSLLKGWNMTILRSGNGGVKIQLNDLNLLKCQNLPVQKLFFLG